MAKTSTTSYPDDLYQAVQDKAKKQGVNFSDGVRIGAELWTRLDPVVEKSVEKIAKAMDITVVEVLQNFAIRVIAENAAFREIYGGDLPDINRAVFAWDGDKDQDNLVTGDALYYRLKEKFARRFREQRLREIHETLQYVGDPEKLSPEDQDFLEKMHKTRDPKKRRMEYWVKKIEEQQKRIDQIKQYQGK